MKALVFEAVGQAISYKEIERPKPQKGQVLVQLAAAALNHRDVYITQGLYPGLQPNIVLGSDGGGTILAVGDGVDPDWIDQEVIINPSIGWERKTSVQPKSYSILGMPSHGCMAEYVCVHVAQIYHKPQHLSMAEAAALPLAGLTAYRALFTKADLQHGERVLISGVGGGVALFACQFAIAVGAEVYVTSGSEEKIQQAIALGAKGGVNYKTENWHKILLAQSGGGMDVIIDSAGGDGFKYFLDLAAPGGRIAFYGGTRGRFQVNPQKMFWKQLSMFGSTMGSGEEFRELLNFVEAKKLHPVISKAWTLEQGAAAFDYLNEGKQFGKVVLNIL